MTALSSLTRSSIERLRTDRDHVAALRGLAATLTEGLPSITEPKDFLIALLYKGLTEDILSNSMEDDYIRYRALSPLVHLLVDSWGHIVEADDLHESDRWLEDLVQFAKLYSKLPASRRSGDVVSVRGVKFFTAVEEDPLLGPPLENQDVDTTLRMFPNLDNTITDPETCAPILQWYGDTVTALVSGSGTERGPIDALCFIEKPYSTVGALGLSAYLVNRTQKTAAIYRSGYWDPQARLRGTLPLGGASVALIYDVAITGAVLVEAARFLRQTLDATVRAAVVLYDFSYGAAEKLRSEDIDFVFYLDRQTLQTELEAQYTFVASLRKAHERFTSRVRKQGPLDTQEVDRAATQAIDEALEQYNALLPTGT